MWSEKAPATGAPAPRSARPGSDSVHRGAHRETPRTGHGRLINDILSERRRKGGHKRSVSGAPPTSKLPLITQIQSACAQSDLIGAHEPMSIEAALAAPNGGSGSRSDHLREPRTVTKCLFGEAPDRRLGRDGSLVPGRRFVGLRLGASAFRSVFTFPLHEREEHVVDDLGDDAPGRRGAPDDQLVAEQVGG